MTIFDDTCDNKNYSNNSSSQSSADLLAAMRPKTPIPGRTITHSANSASVEHDAQKTVGRIITESDHSISEILKQDD